MVKERNLIGITVASKSYATCYNIYLQLTEIFGADFDIDYYFIDSGEKRRFKNRVLLITSPLLKDYFKPFTDENTCMIFAERSIDYRHLRKVITLEKDTDVLLVNDVKETCQETINQLVNLGLDHVNYHPYYLGIDSYVKADIAITPGEAHLVPNDIEQVLDIGTRIIDITTLVELIKALEQLDDVGTSISAQYIKTIIDILKKSEQFANESLEHKNVFESIFENSSDGLVFLDHLGVVKAVNQVFLDLVGDTVDSTYKDNFIIEYPQFGNLESEFTNEVLQIGNYKIVASKCSIKRSGKVSGYLITVKDIEEIKKIDNEVRLKLRKSKHSAIYSFDNIKGVESKTMKNTLKLAKKLSVSDSTILIQGESGTGKELLAQAVHNNSTRKKGPFVPVNFAALTSNLLESELFGYEEGAFTGAKKGGKLGLFEEAEGGTIFLDEIGDAPMELQVRLLRVLQEREIRRVGGNRRIPIDVRVIAATNKDVYKKIEEGTFRQDLFYRINVLSIELPSLRDRKDDIVPLLNVYLSKFMDDKIQSDEFFDLITLDYLVNHEWLGNIRELKNLIEYLVHIKERNIKIGIEDLPKYMRNVAKGSMHEINLLSEKECIQWILNVINQNGSAGRRSIAKIAQEERKNLTEAKIRRLLVQMEELKLIRVSKGTLGTQLTWKGMQMLKVQ